MQHFYSLDDLRLKGVWLTIGAFDGVHRGHQAIITDLCAGARNDGAQATVLTFHPHPARIVRNRTGPYYLTTPDERARLIGNLGVDIVITHPFNHKVAQKSAYNFLAEVQRALEPDQLYVGHDFALGRDREGDVTWLRELGSVFGYALNVIEPVQNEGEVISSSRIRTALSDGDISYAEKMLGRPFRISGTVVPGDGRGKSLGIPTANLEVWPELMLPKTGVYACIAHYADNSWKAVANIGVRPTFKNQELTARVEAHLLDFDQDIYDKQIQIDLFARIRDEVQFSSVDALSKQIQRDIEYTKQILG